MTREQIEARIADIERQRQQRIDALAKLDAQRERMVADLHACAGALQDCQWWLAQIEIKEKPTLAVVDDAAQR